MATAIITPNFQIAPAIQAEANHEINRVIRKENPVLPLWITYPLCAILMGLILYAR